MSAVNAAALLAAAGGDYQISRSVRLRSSASAYLNRTPAAASNRKTWTWSGWLKRGALGVRQGFFSCQNGAGNASLQFGFLDNDCFQMGNGNVYLLQSTALYRDPSAYYHCIVSVDTTLASNRSKVYINGNQITTWATNVFDSNVAQNTDLAINNNLVHYLGQIGANLSYFDGYLTEVNFIDGQALTPSSFGETDAVTGVWKPKKYAGTYGTNGFYLNFSDPSAATAAAIGKDSSGNGNNWTPNNISVTAGVTYDSMVDVPTMWADGGNGRGNYAVLNPLAWRTTYSNTVPTNGNLTCTSADNSRFFTATMAEIDKTYFELTATTVSGSGVSAVIWQSENPQSGAVSALSYISATGVVSVLGTTVFTGATFTSGDVIGLAHDSAAGTVAVYKNGTLQGTATGLPTSINLYAGCTVGISSVVNANFGQRPFAYTPPTGFKALNTQNLPEATIKKGNQYFDATLWAGNGSTQSIVNSGAMQPDMAWIKRRESAGNNAVFDAVRGVGNVIVTNSTGPEVGSVFGVSAFNTNGFALGSHPDMNASGGSYVGWQWKAGGTAVSNTSGSITSQVSANTTAGFSVVTATSNGANPFTVGHGLGVTPAMYIFKNRDAVDNWNVWHKSLASATDSYLLLNTTAAAATNAGQWGAGATSTTIGIRGSSLAANGQKIVLYCFAEVAGFSKFGSYTGNGSTNGPFVYCGFRPKFVMVKRTDGAASWYSFDSVRNTYNLTTQLIFPNTSDAEVTGSTVTIDILSNGFKLRGTSIEANASGGTYIYAAFAENPFKNSLAR